MIKIITTILFLLSNICFANYDKIVMAHKIDDVISLDPAAMFEFTSLEIANNVYQTLVKFDEQQNKIIGVVAKHWYIEPEGNKYIFTIRDDIFFSSGAKITPEDVAFSLKRAIQLNKSPAYLLTQFGIQTDDISVNKDKVIISFPKAYTSSLILSCLSNPVASILEKRIVLQHQVDNDLGYSWLSKNSAGSGPFTLLSWKVNEHIILERNDFYKNNRPLVNKIFIKHVAEIPTQKLLLEQGDVDIARHVDEANSNYYLLESKKGWLKYLSLNQNHPILSKPEVVKAIKLIIDRNAIADAMPSKNLIPHTSFIPAGFRYSQSRNLEPNLDKAKQLLSKAKLNKGFKVTLDTKDIHIAQILQAQLAQANIQVEIIPGSSKQVLTKFRNREHEMLLATWGTDFNDPHANASSFMYNQNNNEDTDMKTIAWRSNWYIPNLSEQTSLAIVESNEIDRRKIYSYLEKEFIEKSPVIILFQAKEIVGVRHNVSGFKLGATSDTTDYREILKIG